MHPIVPPVGEVYTERHGFSSFTVLAKSKYERWIPKRCLESYPSDSFMCIDHVTGKITFYLYDDWVRALNNEGWKKWGKTIII